MVGPESSPDLEPPAETSESPLGRRARKALATRNALFQAGLGAFENRPIAVVSVLDLTEASDVAKGVFYLHFRGKDEYLIALWEHVQRGFLDALRRGLQACRSRRARLEGAVAQYHALAETSPRECRFWLRMSSYFGDEIGQPGHMSRLRRGYLQQLAAMVAGVPLDAVGPDETRVAAQVDGLCWGMISQAIQLDLGSPDRESLVRAVASAVRELEKQ